VPGAQGEWTGCVEVGIAGIDRLAEDFGPSR